MTYLDQANLSRDATFTARLQAAVTSEARVKLATGSSALATRVMEVPVAGLWAFMPWVTSEPGFDVPEPSITDPMILSAVQAVWDEVETQGLPAAP